MLSYIVVGADRMCVVVNAEGPEDAVRRLLRLTRDDRKIVQCQPGFDKYSGTFTIQNGHTLTVDLTDAERLRLLERKR